MFYQKLLPQSLCFDWHIDGTQLLILKNQIHCSNVDWQNKFIAEGGPTYLCFDSLKITPGISRRHLNPKFCSGEILSRGENSPQPKY